MSGKVFKSRVSGIHPGDAEKVLRDFKHILNRLNIGVTRIDPIGSYYRKKVLGDLDLLVKTDASLEELAEKIKGKYPSDILETKIFKGLNIVSCYYDYPRSFSRFQIDLFVHPNRFSNETLDIFYGHVKEEKYTNKHRIFLLFALTESKIRENPNGESYFRFSLRPDGIYNIEKSNKTHKTIDKEFVTNNVHDISELVFVKRLPYDEWNTFEKIWNLAKETYDMTIVAEKFKKHNLETPKEIADLDDIKC